MTMLVVQLKASYLYFPSNSAGFLDFIDQTLSPAFVSIAKAAGQVNEQSMFSL